MFDSYERKGHVLLCQWKLRFDAVSYSSSEQELWSLQLLHPFRPWAK